MVMSMVAKREITNVLRVRYALADRTQKGIILDEFVASFGYCRKYAISLLGKPSQAAPPKRRRLRQRLYPSSLMGPLTVIWEACNHICSKRLKPFLPEIIGRLEHFNHLRLSEQDRQLLKKMSVSTLERLLKRIREDRRPHGRCTTKPSFDLKQAIPIRSFAAEPRRDPGHLELDLVAHCGPTLSGDYVCTLDTIDMATCWSECIVPAGRGQIAVLAALRELRERLPFPLLSIDSDNDGSFINGHLFRYCQHENIKFSRSRPYKKNDQAHVEQKNWSIVRQLLGYDRYETDAVPALNGLYKDYRLYVNFFQPVLKLQSKTRVDARVRKVYDEAQTPYRRVLASACASDQSKAKLTMLYEQLDPVTLKENVDRCQREIWEKRRVRFLYEATTPPK